MDKHIDLKLLSDVLLKAKRAREAAQERLREARKVERAAERAMYEGLQHEYDLIWGNKKVETTGYTLQINPPEASNG